jgi:alpha-L-fucosidase
VVVDLPEKKKINHVVTMEDYRFGHRIREYKIEGFIDGNWKKLCSGQSVGRKKIDYFDEVEISKIRLNVTKSVNDPVIRKLSAYYVEDFVAPPKRGIRPWSDWQNIGVFNTKGNATMEVNLTGKIKIPGQFTVKVEAENSDVKMKINNVELIYDGQVVLDKFTTVKGNEININRTAQVTDENKITLRFTLKSKTDFSGKILFKPVLIY